MSANQYIIDLEERLGGRLSKISFENIMGEQSISYSWGDERELVNMLMHQDRNEEYQGNFITVSGTGTETTSKYPLIWLLTPVKGSSHGSALFKNVSIIISVDTREEWLDETSDTTSILEGIAEQICKLKGGIDIQRIEGKKQFKYRKLPKLSVPEEGSEEAQNIALDWWKAILIETSLIVS